MLLNRQQIQASSQLQMKEVTVPEFGGEVKVRGLMIAEAQEVRRLGKKLLEQLGIKPDDLTPETIDLSFSTGISIRAAEFGVIDPATNERLFGDGEVEKLPEEKRNAVIILGEAILRLSGMIPEAREEVEKNSQPTQNSNSSTDSPAT